MNKIYYQNNKISKYTQKTYLPISKFSSLNKYTHIIDSGEHFFGINFTTRAMCVSHACNASSKILTKANLINNPTRASLTVHL